MLYLYTGTDQTLDTNDKVAFINYGVTVGSHVRKGENGTILLTSPGVYEIHFNADLANNTSTSGEVSTQMYVNGGAYGGAVATATSSGLTNVQNIGFTALVRVRPNCCVVADNLPAVLSFVNTGVEAVYANAALTIKKVK